MPTQPRSIRVLAARRRRLHQDSFDDTDEDGILCKGRRQQGWWTGALLMRELSGTGITRRVAAEPKS